MPPPYVPAIILFPTEIIELIWPFVILEFISFQLSPKFLETKIPFPFVPANRLLSTKHKERTVKLDGRPLLASFQLAQLLFDINTPFPRTPAKIFF